MNLELLKFVTEDLLCGLKTEVRTVRNGRPGFTLSEIKPGETVFEYVPAEAGDRLLCYSIYPVMGEGKEAYVYAGDLTKYAPIAADNKEKRFLSELL